MSSDSPRVRVVHIRSTRRKCWFTFTGPFFPPRWAQQVIALRYSHMCSGVCVSRLRGRFLFSGPRWWDFIYSALRVSRIDVTFQRPWITTRLAPVRYPHLMLCLSVLSHNLVYCIQHSSLLIQVDAHPVDFLFPLCKITLLSFSFPPLSVLSFSSPSLSPSGCLPLCVRSTRCVFVPAFVCVCVCSEMRGERKACEPSEFLWLQPFLLSSSLPLLFCIPADGSGSDT